MLVTALSVLILGSACLGGHADRMEDVTLLNPEVRAAEIESLKAAIQRDHRMLEDLVTQTGRSADQSLHEDAELRAIAKRLPEQERRLELLESNSGETNR
jgi:hypothetical protein